MMPKAKAALLIISISTSCGFQSFQSSSPLKRASSQLKLIHHLLHSTNNENDDGSFTPQDDTGSTKTTVTSQAALIAGTTIGGGFLALPAATAPGGLVPSAIGLVAVWTYLLGCSLSFANAIFLLKDNNNRIEEDTRIKRNKNAEEEEISIFSLVRECFGNMAGVATGLLFLLLIKATLVAQLSKVGVLLQSNILLPTLSRGAWTILFSFVVTAVCLVGKQRHIERINDVMTSTMLLSFATLIALAGRSGWAIDGLKRANYRSLFPSMGSPWVAPIFIQLLLYNEVVPLVSARLVDEKKVRRAILCGSSIPLLMCLIWSCVALGIVPYEPTLGGTSSIYDPLSKLGEQVLSKGGSIGKIFLTSVFTMAGSAICTTVFGSILATIQYLDDVIANSFSGRTDTSLTRMFKYSFAIFPSALIAALGSSELYYHATSFAGEYPCTLLFGLIPPLCNLRLRWKLRKQGGISESKVVAIQMLLSMLSVAILAACRLSRS